MDSYFEIKAIPDAEMLQSTVMGVLIQDLHRLLPEYQGRVGVSFPAYGQSRTLGGIIRLHGSAADLQKLQQQSANSSQINSYGLVTAVSATPTNIALYAHFQRLRVKSNSAIRRLKKRHMQRGSWNPELEQAIEQKYGLNSVCPHVLLKSYSTNQPRFPLFIQRKMNKQPSSGSFNSYGLSKTATVPWF